jgi:hypothetical protein
VQPYAPLVYSSGGNSENSGNSGIEGKARKAALFGTVVFTPSETLDKQRDGNSEVLEGTYLKGTYLGDWDEKNKCPHGESGTVRTSCSNG